MRGNEPEAEKHRSFYDEYNAVCDLPAEFYLQTVKVVFQDNALAKGTWKVGSHLINPSAITSTALLTVEGELDDITGIGQTSAAHDLTPHLPADKKEIFVAEGSGHYGIFSGSRWRNNVFPVVANFINAAQEDEEQQLLARLRAEVELAIRKENEAKERAKMREQARMQRKAAEEAEIAKAKAREEALEKAKQEALEAAEAEAKLLASARAKAAEEAKAKAEAEKKAAAEAERFAKTAEAKANAEAQSQATTVGAKPSSPQTASGKAAQRTIGGLAAETTTAASTPKQATRKQVARKMTPPAAKK